jgi:hypothetical protein
VTYLGRVLQWCCEHDYWREHHGDSGGELAPPKPWIDPPVIEPDWEDSGDYESELQAALREFQAERGGAVGGGTVALDIPGAR